MSETKSKKVHVTAMINGVETEVLVEGRQTLLEVLRDGLGLTGTKEGCGNGNCGACTLHIDGKPVNSCLVLAPEIDGREVTTIEGLAERGELTALQRAFLERGSLQCGVCTPGFLMNATALLRDRPDPSEEEIRTVLAGNLCRCTGYDKIIKAVQDAAAELRAAGAKDRRAQEVSA
ncbi:MAG TPA: (2Fe-2S)-binding protein [Limnochordia bacterium]|nr:(2Fe-2S)-binding protein [Limnochordia bacterium]